MAISHELKFSKPLPEPITCIFYLEYDNSFRVGTLRTIPTDFLKNGQDADIVYSERHEIILGSLPLRYVAALRHAVWHGPNQCLSSHREKFTLSSLHLLPKSSSAYFFDSYGIVPLVPDIAVFKRRNCTVWDCNRRQVQGLTSNICRKYCCLFAL